MNKKIEYKKVENKHRKRFKKVAYVLSWPILWLPRLINKAANKKKK